MPKKLTHKNYITHSDKRIKNEIMVLKAQLAKLEKENKKLKQLKQEALESESKYRSLFEMSDDAILVIDNTKFVDCNKAVVKMLGYKSKKELLNTHPSELSPKTQPDGRNSFEKAQEMMQIAHKKGSCHFEWIHTRANGENFPVEVWLSSVTFNGKKIINTVWRDLTEKKKAERLINRNLEEKEILLKEIHHRVKNNLQVIVSLINLQLHQVEDKKTKSVLTNSKNRILSMSKIHEMLYQSKDLSHIDYGKYIETLCFNLIDSIKGNKHNIKLLVDVKNIHLNITTAIPLGLLINEIISNSLKHGIPNNHQGTVFIRIHETSKKQLLMEIGDNGIGYSDKFSSDTQTTLGLQLIYSLADQLNGRLKKIKTARGTKYEFKFERV